MQVREIMTPSPTIVPPDCSLKDLAAKMRDQDIGALPVCDGDRLVGMVTDRDIVVRGVAMDKSADAAVRDVMSPGSACVHEDDEIEEAERQMARHHVRRLPVLNKDQRLVGMVSLADLVEKAGFAETTQQVVEEVSKPTPGESRRM